MHGDSLIQRVQRAIERWLPWFDPEAEQAHCRESAALMASSRTVRANATRTIHLRNGYRSYGDRVRR